MTAPTVTTISFPALFRNPVTDSSVWSVCAR
jgi:hypothetical protein